MRLLDDLAVINKWIPYLVIVYAVLVIFLLGMVVGAHWMEVKMQRRYDEIRQAIQAGVDYAHEERGN